jgi:Tfp pilus assembly protein PilE
MKSFQFSVFNFQKNQQGFTFVEAIIYVAIISIILNTLIPFTWNVVEGQRKSATQEEVSSQARMISERIKWEIRNAVSITSVSASTLVLCEGNPCSGTNVTTITFTGSSVTIAPAPAPTPVTLDSNDVTVTGTFTNNSSGTLTKNVSFSLTVTENQGARKEFKQAETIQSSAELRNL